MTTLAARDRLFGFGMSAPALAALLLVILAGMREGSAQDRALSTVAIATTSTPEYVSGVVLTVIFASQMVGLQWFSGSATKAAEDGPTLYTFALPVLTIAIYGMGYIARMTRASMAEVMTQQYIRTARLKGVSFRTIVLRHALLRQGRSQVSRAPAAVIEPVATG